MMSVATATAMLRPVDQAYLDENNFVWDAVVDAGMVCVTIKEYSLAAGLTPAVNELLIRLPSGFPDVGPDMFWLAEPVARVDGVEIPAIQVSEIYLTRSWQRWSRHIGAGWRPGVDDLRNYMAYIATCIQAAAK